MSNDDLRNQFFVAKANWEEALFELHRARATYDYTEKQLVIARERMLLEAMRYGRELDQITVAELTPVQLLGKTIKQAAQASLYALNHATVDQLVDYMTQHGFQFSGEVPVREVHGALMKQPWAKRNQRTSEWEYVIQ